MSTVASDMTDLQVCAEIVAHLPLEEGGHFDCRLQSFHEGRRGLCANQEDIAPRKRSEFPVRRRGLSVQRKGCIGTLIEDFALGTTPIDVVME